jgi:hypothetical protein
LLCFLLSVHAIRVVYILENNDKAVSVKEPVGSHHVHPSSPDEKDASASDQARIRNVHPLKSKDKGTTPVKFLTTQKIKQKVQAKSLGSAFNRFRSQSILPFALFRGFRGLGRRNRESPFAEATAGQATRTSAEGGVKTLSPVAFFRFASNAEAR